MIYDNVLERKCVAKVPGLHPNPTHHNLHVLLNSTWDGIRIEALTTAEK